MLSQTLTSVNRSPRNGGWGNGWVAATRDGSVYRWQRHDGRCTIRTSTEAFLTVDAAVAAAASVATCYGAQFVGVK